MKMFEAIPVFILLFTGHLCNAQYESTTLGHLRNTQYESTTLSTIPPAKEAGPHVFHEDSSGNPATGTLGSDGVPGRSLPTLVVAGVSIALVLLCILIVAVFWYAWKKSQEGSMELNPIPYGEAGASLRSLSVPEKQQEGPFERAVP